MNRELLKGHLDVMLLAVVAQGPLHGYAIIQSLNELSDGSFDLPEGTIYPALHRLESARLVASRWTTVDGRRRRTYRLTKRGAATLTKRTAEWRGFQRAMNAVLKGA
jgi:DNA-binding PadR family transcriptional regulator